MESPVISSAALQQNDGNYMEYIPVSFLARHRTSTRPCCERLASVTLSCNTWGPLSEQGSCDALIARLESTAGEQRVVFGETSSESDASCGVTL